MLVLVANEKEGVAVGGAHLIKILGADARATGSRRSLRASIYVRLHCNVTGCDSTARCAHAFEHCTPVTVSYHLYPPRDHIWAV